MIIRISGAEQKPYAFPGIETIVAPLPTGDYSVEGYTGHGGQPCGIAIERKNVDLWQRDCHGHLVEYDCGGDLVSSLTAGRDRLEAEFERGRKFDYFALVVESSLSAIARGWKDSDADPKAIIQNLIGLSVRYQVPVWLAGNRADGAYLTEILLFAWLKLRAGAPRRTAPAQHSATVLGRWPQRIRDIVYLSVAERRPVWLCDTTKYAERVMESIARHAARNRVRTLGGNPDSIDRVKKSRWTKAREREKAEGREAKNERDG